MDLYLLCFLVLMSTTFGIVYTNTGIDWYNGYLPNRIHRFIISFNMVVVLPLLVLSFIICVCFLMLFLLIFPFLYALGF